MSYTQKPIPNKILIFAAAGHLGTPLAEFLTRQAPHIGLRLVSRDSSKRAELQRRFPNAEVVPADYLDPASLARAAQGIEGAFVLTPGGTDEEPAMTNLVEAFHRTHAKPHVIRLVGMQPEFNPRLVPEWLKQHRLGLPIQHPIAKRILDESGLAVTYLNSNATFMDNFTRYMAPAVRTRRVLIWPERRIPYIDPAEIAEMAGRLFLSNDQREFGQFHTINNGQDILRYGEVAEIMSDVFGERVIHDPSKESFFREYAWVGHHVLDYLWNFFKFEEQNEIGMSRNDLLEQYIGRRPMNVREWLVANRAAFDRNQ